MEKRQVIAIEIGLQTDVLPRVPAACEFRRPA